MPMIIVFLGPSLPREEARQIVEATFRPPAARGDITQAVDDGADIICLIDGVFFQECAVGHREILRALERGVKVIGASSMGALRSAELDTLGMEGVGIIYTMYRQGIIESDDEVAVIFDPVSGAPLSEPMVNIRATLRKALDCGILDKVSYDTLLSAALSLYYPDRTYSRICEEVSNMVDREVIERFLIFIRNERVDLKAEDARLALRYVRTLGGTP